MGQVRDAPAFRVLHKDGSEWDMGELESLVRGMDRSRLVWCDLLGFLVDDCGDAYLADECGNWASPCELGIEDDDVVVEWMEGDS